MKCVGYRRKLTGGDASFQSEGGEEDHRRTCSWQNKCTHTSKTNIIND
jgi:hypothetical protein